MNEGCGRNLRRERFVATHAATGASGVEETRDARGRVRVFEQRKKINRAVIGFEQRVEVRARRAVVRRRRMRAFENFAQLGEGVQKFETRLRVMRFESRGVATLVAATRDLQVVVRASGEAAQLGLARRRRRLDSHIFDGQREADVAFDRRARFAHRRARRDASRAGSSNRSRGGIFLTREVFRSIQGGEQRAARVVDPEFARRRRNALRCCGFASPEIFLNEWTGKECERPAERGARRVE